MATKEYNRAYYLANKLKLDSKSKIRSKVWYETNKEKRKLYLEENPDKVKEWRKSYYLKNKEKLNKSQKQYHYSRLKTDIAYRLKCNLRRRLHKAVLGITKSASTMELLDCTIDQLREYLQLKFTENMNWNNYGNWHIVPCAKFDLTDPAQQKTCFHYTNLQPLWAADNMAKGAK